MSKKGFFNNFSVLPASSWFDFFIKNFKKIVGIVIIVLLGIILLLGWMSAKKVREVVIEDFNQQQLVLARRAASQIENSLYNLKRELDFLSLFPSVQYSDIPFMDKHMEITFLKNRDQGVMEIRFVENVESFKSQGIRTHILNNQGYKVIEPNSEDIDYLNWAKQAEKDNFFISDIYHADSDSNGQMLILKIVIPVRQVFIDNRHPVATDKFSGALLFVVDASVLIQKITKDLRSGKTGYAWVIDNRGTFLYHPEEEFIGKNAFEARKEKKPTISFARINEIQKDMMLKGKEGTSWYISGWHLGIEGEVKKLIAYTPIRLDKNDASRIWSVAVVAPITEVESVIRSVQIRQFLLEGVVIVAILLGGVAIIGIMLRWSSALSDEVEKKTGELKKSEYQYRSLIENANDIIFTVDSKGVITSINNAGLLFFGKKREEIIGLNIGEICFNEESAALQLKAVEEAFRGESKKITYSINMGGGDHWLSTNFSPLFDEKGRPYAVLGISRDITAEKKRAIEEQMYHTEKLASMGTLAAGVAHEINNPLAIILGFSDMLLEKAKPGSNEYDMLKTIEKHALNAKRVVENLLSFARYTEHKEEFIDINSNIKTVLDVVENTLKLNNISLNCQLSDKLPKVKADAGEMQQVFLNIINNAIHAMKGGGTLTVTTELSDSERVVIRFADTGHGIKKEHRTKIFDPLFTTKKVGEGTGLGLSVSYGIITKYGGTITFETKTKDESDQTGTTFIITLPAIKQ